MGSEMCIRDRILKCVPRRVAGIVAAAVAKGQSAARSAQFRTRDVLGLTRLVFDLFPLGVGFEVRQGLDKLSSLRLLGRAGPSIEAVSMLIPSWLVECLSSDRSQRTLCSLRPSHRS